ncbi:DUF4411 family protein [Helicobacter didelphidarum]|uniref:DUF4411 family protein n=1 Tax=Helicobacter didelphidarum TaxID=2040648 RepID=UPI002482D682|nr:DUF4411 family protein [Helicobacter didelphidarum]
MGYKFFLDSSLRYYQNDFFPDFWIWLKIQSNTSHIKTIRKVKQELLSKKDFISNFINELPLSFFIDDKKYLSSYSQVIQTAQLMNFRQNAKEKFADANKADAWLIAVALQDNYTIVSNEKIPDKQERQNIKIPRMCNELNIECINIFDFIKEQKIIFYIKDLPQEPKQTLF